MKRILFFPLLIVSLVSYSQTKQYLYYFDKDLNSVEKTKAVFYGTGDYDNGLMKLMLYNNTGKHLIMIEHFTDSTLQLCDGAFTSYYTNAAKESEGNYDSGKLDGWWERSDSSNNITDSTLYRKVEVLINISYLYFADKKIQSIEYNDLKNHKYLRTVYDEVGNIARKDTTMEDEDKVFTKEEIEPQFPGGEQTWNSYIDKQIAQHANELNGNDRGTCQVRFIVSKMGSVSEIKVISGNYGLAKIVMNAIKMRPKWVPGMQNGRQVTAYKIVSVTYK